MNQVSDRGTCFSEDINKIEEQKASFDSTESNVPSADGIGAQSIFKLCRNSVQECAEPIDCNVDIILTEKDGDVSRISEVLQEDESIDIYQRNKRLKKTLLSEPPTTDLETIEEDGSENGGEVPIDKSNENMSENRDADMLTLLEHKAENDIVFNVVSTETDNNTFPRVVADGRPESPLHLDKEVLPESNGAETIEKNSCDTNTIAINLPKELHDEAKETVSDVEVCDVEFAEENSKQLDGLEGVAPQVANESINIEVSRGFAGYMGKKLLVLDLNGLLADISSYVPYDYDPDDIILRKAVFKRPYCDDFLKFCFERFNVGVWSSKTKRNVEPILDLLFGKDKDKLLFCWDQSHCTDTGYGTVEKRHKPLLLKKLKKLWDKYEPNLPWEKGVYNESNTLLLDDTPYKALSNPRYTAIFPYTYRFQDVQDISLGPGGDLRVYLEGLAMADNVQEYVKQNPFGQRPITEKNLSWGYYLKVIEASSTPPRENEEQDDSRRETF